MDCALTDFPPENLTDENRILNGSTFHRVDLGGMKVTGSKAVTTRFDDLNMQDLAVENANLTGATFHNVNMTGAWISHANLSSVAITDANLTGMTINGIAVSDLLALWEEQ